MSNPTLFYKKSFFASGDVFLINESFVNEDIFNKISDLSFDEVVSLIDIDLIKSLTTRFDEVVSLIDIDLVKSLTTRFEEVMTSSDFFSNQRLLVVYEMTQGLSDNYESSSVTGFSESAFLDDSLNLSVSFNKDLNEFVDLFDGDIRSVSIGLDESLSTLDVKNLVLPRLDLVDSLSSSLESFDIAKVFNEDFLKSYDLDDSFVKSYDLESDEVKSYDLESEVFKQLNK